MMKSKAIAFLVLAGLCASSCGSRPSAIPATDSPTQAPADATATAEQAQTLLWIDTHTHPSTNIVAIDMAGGSREDLAYCLTDECLADMSAVMDEIGASVSFLMPPPGVAANEQYAPGLADAVRRNPERFFHLAGGSVLNAMIHKAAKSGKVSDGLRKDFEEKAGQILAGGAVGFGEMAVLHISHSPSHAFEEAPADHELFLLLADIAARNDVPIDIHMDPVLEDMETPEEIRSQSEQNPAALKGNIPAFETLLAHNPQARIVWAHTADTTGDLSAALLRDMLGRHPNLYLSLRLATRMGPTADKEDIVLDRSGKIQEEWLNLMEDFPGRFVIGSDEFWGEGESVPSQVLVNAFLAQLPADLAAGIACRNVVDIYNLDLACP